ncbi:MAG: LptF/LptG family permease [Robiginitomaculum sp.]|nr:LptF/LptG family permease [Robiginitomaculum sp.]
MISTLNAYLAKRIFIGILTAFSIIVGVIMLIDFVETARGFDASASLFDIIYLTLLNAPQLVEKTIPFIVLFGVMATLYSLNKQSEFIVIRAAGISAWSFLKPAISVTGLIGILWAVSFNPLAVKSAQKHDIIKGKLLKKNQSVTTQATIYPKSIWLREGDEEGYLNIHARSVNIDTYTLYGVTFFQSVFIPDQGAQFISRYDAKTATLMPENYWLLKHVTEYEDGKPTRYSEAISQPTTINRQTLRTQSQHNSNLSFWQIPSEISNAKLAGYDTTPLIIQFHKLLALPITLIAMTTIAAGVALHNVRSGGALIMIIGVASFGFLEYFLDNMVSAFGQAGTLPPVLAAWAVPLLVLFCGLAFLFKIEDG